MFAALASFALTLLQRSGVECADCRFDGARCTLCQTHSEVERTTLKVQGAAYAQTSDPDKRVQILETVARLTKAHVNAPSPVVARFLADGLRAESITERRRALELLLDGQNREETVQGVIDGWREAQKSWRVLDAKLVLTEAQAVKGGIALTTEDLVNVPDYIEASIRAFASLRDDRAVSTLRDILRSPLDRTPGRFLVAASETALALHSRRACESVLDFLSELESALDEGRITKRFGGDAAVDLFASFKARLENASDADRAKIVAALETYATSRNLRPPEPGKLRDSNAWRGWYKLAREVIPDRFAP